jgi:hypothetical protein
MKNPSVLIVHPNNEEEVTVLKAFMQALKIKFEVTKKDNYNPEFVAKILESKEQIAQGKFTEVKKENLKSFIDSL